MKERRSDIEVQYTPRKCIRTRTNAQDTEGNKEEDTDSQEGGVSCLLTAVVVLYVAQLYRHCYMAIDIHSTAAYSTPLSACSLPCPSLCSPHIIRTLLPFFFHSTRMHQHKTPILIILHLLFQFHFHLKPLSRRRRCFEMISST